MWDEVVSGADALIATRPAAGVEAAARTIRAEVRAARGDLPGAFADSSWGIDVARRAGDPQSFFPSLNTHALVLDASGDLDEARRLVAEVFEALDPLKEVTPFVTPGEIIDLWLRLAGSARVTEMLDASWSRETPWLVAARLFVEGDFDGAAALYARAECAPDVAIVHLRAAEHLFGSGRRTEARDHLNAAMAFYRFAAATRFIREAERLLPVTA